MKYIISIDFGSTFSKAIIMKIDNDNITIHNKITTSIIEFKILIDEIILKNNIDSKLIEAIIVTGIRTKHIPKSIFDIPIYTVDEFTAISYGGLLLSKNNEGIVVSLGTGTAIIYSNLNEVKHLFGTALGGGTFFGLNKFFGNYNNIEERNELFNLADRGNKNNVDLKISDLTDSAIDFKSCDITTSNFALYEKECSKEDIVAASLNLVIQNVGLIVSLVKENYLIKNNLNSINVIFIGTLLENLSAKKFLKEISDYTKNNFLTVEYSSYAVAIGAYEYYLLRLRKN